MTATIVCLVGRRRPIRPLQPDHIPAPPAGTMRGQRSPEAAGRMLAALHQAHAVLLNPKPDPVARVLAFLAVRNAIAEGEGRDHG